MLREDEELVRRTRYMPDGIPDTLYMIEEKPTSSSYGLSSLDVLTASIPSMKINNYLFFFPFELFLKHKYVYSTRYINYECNG